MRDNGDKYECHTPNTSCSVTQLMCGSWYNMTVSAHGRYCRSNCSDKQVFQTAPCMPQNVTASVDCVTNAATIVWSPSPGAENYTASAVLPDGGSYVCQSTTSSCNIVGLSCGQKYLITVLATNKESSSKASLPIELLTAPCVPLQQTPQIICSNNSASLSWGQTPGAISYVANVSSTGDQMSCNTTGTNCIINQLKCGQVYNVTVTAINQQCRGPAAIPASLTTVPCQPRNVVVDINCSSSVVRLSWDPSLGAQRYYSMLRTPGNQYLICNNTELGCEIHDLPCGQAYNATVTAINDQCQSEPSSPAALYTVPCLPSQVRPDINCNSNTVTLSWAQTAGAVNYTTVATGPQGEQYYCQSSNTSCSYTQLSCGLRFDASIIAVGKTCSSGFSGALPFYTVPCAVRNIHAQYQCGSDYAAVTWEAATGGVTYTAMLSSEDGWRSICNTSVSSCVVYGLKCGQKYAVTVETFGPSCSNVVNASEFVFTAPCKPQNVTSTIDCLTNRAALSWSRTLGAANYTAAIIGPVANGPTCKSSSTTCSIDQLSCGVIYDFIITPFNAQCEGESSVVAQLVTAPCAPDHLVTGMDCDTGSLVLSWSPMTNIQNFTSNLMGSDNINRTCKSTGANCSFPSLPCGVDYTASVYATNKYCDGPMSRNVTISSAPCVPQAVRPSLNCTDNSVLVSWGVSPGALNYTLSLADSYGDRHNCSNKNTSCRVQDLLCGDVYTVAVTAQNVVCNSKASSVTQFLTAPCSSLNLQANITSNVVTLAWGEAHGAVSYTTAVTGTDGGIHTCQTSNTSCNMKDLMCGHQYSMSVTAIGPQCSKVSASYDFQTAPCRPENVSTQLECASNLVTVSWNVSSGADSYQAEAVGTNGKISVCNATNTSCHFTDLTCGTVYLVTVTADNEVSSSEPSSPIQFKTAPCVPVQQIPQPNCYNDSAFLAWSVTSGAIRYVTNMTGPGGDTYSCQTEGTNCTIRGLKCGQAYSVRITAINEQCNGLASAPVTLTTGPCQPQNVVSNITCSNYSTLVTWDAAPGAMTYVSRLTSLSGEYFLHNSTDTFWKIPGLVCGQSYGVMVTALSSYCQSAPSSIEQLYTVPCVPTDLQAKVDCESHWVSLSWTPVFGAEYYTTVVTGPQMEQYQCVTGNSSCNFTQLSCGLQYKATILAKGKTCNSTISPAITFYTELRSKTLPEAENCFNVQTSETGCQKHLTVNQEGRRSKEKEEKIDKEIKMND
ncbi:fibronectin type III domain-containing protein 7-like [Dendropsophus ebraccatus]|uniref:fibronectin type III domain-containing protein 7-like n=1 Tax=Dendropsophus ebraccatus TaxID=150705 RepID=UPI003831E4C6